MSVSVAFEALEPLHLLACASMDFAYFGLSAETRDLLIREIGFRPTADFRYCSSRDLDAYEVFSGMAHLSTALENAIRLNWFQKLIFYSYHLLHR